MVTTNNSNDRSTSNIIMDIINQTLTTLSIPSIIQQNNSLSSSSTISSTSSFTIDDIYQSLNNETIKLFLRYHHHWFHYLDLIERSTDLNGIFKLFLYFAYLFVFIIGIIGNILVCWVVFRQQSMRSVTNIFITNLALSDILLCLFAVPFTPLYLLTFKEWIFGPVFCRLVPFVQGMSVYISVMTLMSIAIERYMVIIYPFKRHLNIIHSVIVIIIIWLLAFILTLPYGIFIDLIPVPQTTTKHQEQQQQQSTEYDDNQQQQQQQPQYQFLMYDNHNETSSITNDQHEQRSIETLKNLLQNLQKRKWYCDEVWPNDQLRSTFGLLTTIMQFVIPFFIITYCYTKVFVRLWYRMHNRLGSRNYSSQRQWLEKKRARRTNLMLYYNDTRSHVLDQNEHSKVIT